MSRRPLPKTEFKTCTGCGRVLPASAEYFKPLPYRACGLTARCRRCTREEYKRKREAKQP